MLKFLAKGLMRDRSRSLFPIMIIATGVLFTVLMYSWMMGFTTMFIRENARFETGHVKIVTRAYNDLIDQKPYDLGLINVNEKIEMLASEYPQMHWQPRIYFGGLLDLPDENGETLTQGEVIGFGVDLFSDSFEQELLNLEEALTIGTLPKERGDILISQEVAEKLGININDVVTIIGSTMYGSMAMNNFTVCGMVRFGVQAMDRGAVIVDISDVRSFLNMEDSASEILGFLPEYKESPTFEIADIFNAKYNNENDEFSDIMLPLRKQANMEMMINTLDERLGMFIFVFIFIMSLVLWNSGLMNGIRRYGEIGVRLAIGESKGHIYRSLILESFLIGIAATIIGTVIGLGFSYLLQYNGLDIGSMMKDANMIMGATMQAQVTPVSYYIGFIPGVIASVIGAIFSGIGIYKRNTAQLFKELET
ncbi:MAG: FtsX-like permease family protein [Candidatus Cloacimonetes bacterium]|jgi:putative ABC transport system permease protein|nr:FtsX-like permease family protein [Candidatus Cloacimonadota bacterium]